MSKRDDGNTAFPVTEANGANTGWPGMTLRDWFAGQALAGLVWKNGNRAATVEAAEQVAEQAYLFADAMLAEREK